MKLTNIKYILIAGVGLWLTSCNSEEVGGLKTSNRGYSFEATIENYDFGDPVETRAIRNPEEVDDGWSYTNFENGDVVGFYSLYGNLDAPGGNGRFNNVPMVYGNKSFFNYEMNYDISSFVEKKAFYYFPYDENAEVGIELREKLENGEERCKDLLWIMAPGSATDRQNFSHAFSSLVILRGEGFDDPKAGKESIKVYLTEGYSHAQVVEVTDYLKKFELVYQSDYPKSQDECKEWIAWEGGSYTVSDKDGSAYKGKTFERAWYVILPSKRTPYPVVDHIEISDNEGRLHKLNNFSLYDINRRIPYGRRYPLVVKMDKYEAVVVPVSILPWEDTQEIQETRNAGIGDIVEFMAWKNTYDQYLSESRNSEIIEELQRYGEYNETTDKWTFYINSDIDLTEQIAERQANIIARLDDILEGNHHRVTGLVIENSGSPSFIGEIGSGGEIRNLTFTNVNIKSSSNDAVGALCGKCSGKVDNCDIDGSVTSNGPVGMIAGEAEGAVISNCEVKGFIKGSATSFQGLIGRGTLGEGSGNNKTTGLITLTE
ncbi:MAG: hypothetical protein J1D77_02680 [Muribaculaceae bacterium]|nr:hypothetical protein [Muribaculaceae bacterium]